MKKIVQITLHKKIEVEETQIQKNDKGEEIKALVKVKTKKPYNYFIRKPNRSLSESGELFYNKIYWECVNQGIKPSVALQKRYLDDGGVLSEDQKKDYQKLYEDLFTAQAELKQSQEKKNKTDVEKKQEEDIFTRVVDLFSSIQTVESQAGNNLYQHTAENISRNRTTIWWMLFLSHQDVDGNMKEVFPGVTYEDKLKIYDTFEENEDPFEIELIQKLLLITSLWYFGKAETQEDFDIALKLAENKEIIGIGEALEEAAKQEVKEEIKDKVIPEPIKKEVVKKEEPKKDAPITPPPAPIV